jgi:3-oxoacyl-[acyl-carrier-protein] synthase III
MFILGTSEYLPARVVDNEYFGNILGKPASWFVERTGIQERRRCAPDENLHTMGIAAVAALRAQHASLADIGLVIGASYTPLDTIGTLAHVVQREFSLQGARAIYLSTACSSFMDALDIAGMYLKAGAVRKALIVAAEHNSAYSRDDDVASGHLWGDGAAAVLLGAADDNALFEVLDIETKGLGDLGRGPEAVSLRREAGLQMPYGREVFAQASEEMARAIRSVLSGRGLRGDDVRLMVAHQANRRILDRVAGEFGFSPERVALTIDSLGNTGCASVAITLHRYVPQIRRGELVVLATFGGGYSVGAALLRCTGEPR